MASWLPIPRRAKPPLLSTTIDLRPAPVAATAGGTGSAVRAAMERVRAVAAAADPLHEPETAEVDARQVDAPAMLIEALDELEREVSRLITTTAQEVARVRALEREATLLGTRVGALRQPRRPTPPDA